MPDVPQIDFNNTAVNMLPFLERKTKWIIFVRALLSPITRLYGIFIEFKDGVVLSGYNNLTAYGIGATVRYNFKMWESLTAGNIGNQPDISPAAWILRNNSFIGAIERAKYNGWYLQLTYALNRQFSTTFRQPPYPDPYDYGLGGGVFSDIYITNKPPVYKSFVMYPDDARSSKMYPTYSSGYLFEPPLYGGATTYGFNIHFPVAAFNALGANDSIRTSIITQFVNKVLVSGTNFSIITY